MRKHVATAVGIFALVASTAVVAAPKNNADHEPKGNAYGYWAGRLCDHVGSTTGGLTYWESRGYDSRDECVEAEGQSLARGEWDPDNWPEI